MGKSKYGTSRRQFIQYLLSFGAARAAYGKQPGGTDHVSTQTSGKSAKTTSSPDSLSRILHEGIINAHEHLQSEDRALDLLSVMDQLGIERIALVGSPRFTFTLNEKYGFSEHETNNRTLLGIAKKYAGRFDIWPTVDPLDSNKLKKLKQHVSDGAVGLKLYVGHGYRRTDSGEYLFHSVEIDSPKMTSVYQYCQEHFIPICFHVNPGPKTPGFAKEFINVLQRFPNLKVNCPHFILSSIQSSRLEEFLDTFPNIYTDISFGHDLYLSAGLKRISRDTSKFRRLFEKYPNRFLFATDSVITLARHKTPVWISVRYRAYIDMLLSDEYFSPVAPGHRLLGMKLGSELATKVFRKNYVAMVEKQPKDTAITRQIDWTRMGSFNVGQ